MKKKFKGGMKPGIIGGVRTGLMYILIPLIPLIVISMYAPEISSSSDVPPYFQTLFKKLWVIPLALGWLMIMTGFARKYYRRGSFQRMVSELSYIGGKGLYLFALMGPFSLYISIDEGGGGGGFGLDYSTYFAIIYILLALTGVYVVFEYFVLKNDLEAYYEGEIPDDYYPKGQKPPETPPGAPPEGVPPAPSQTPPPPPEGAPPVPDQQPPPPPGPLAPQTPPPAGPSTPPPPPPEPQ